MIPRATEVKYFKEDWFRENTYRHLKHNQDMLCMAIPVASGAAPAEICPF
jgi:hypothetical protein